MVLTPTVLREYDASTPTETATATFGLGCFWGPDATFGAVDGVVKTRVGYAGGTKDEPSYRCIGDHTEVVQLEYDPEQVAFRELLDIAFAEHSPSHQPEKRQYQHIIFTDSDSQRQTLDKYLDTNGYDPDTIGTRLEPLSAFHVAELYHQKFNLSGKRWITEPLEKAGYDDRAIRESPAAAKLNAHVAGHDITVPFLSEPAGYTPGPQST
ncbi:peptide-methionine (S)-S-oxide reductase MsrA [Halovenus rubra]|uniref:peptide-methionine (S)-S-oxide reductase n=2 Tax=Halovenus rubra TaxID=869890 RepID=A0ABD5X4D7_9EURY|nr:peptide-methionine (S)-S-oxide reductase [Halovenus rubra]